MHETPKTLEPQVRLERTSEVFVTEVDDELVMLDDARGLYFGLNAVGRKIWESLAAPTTYETLLKTLTSHFEGDPEKIRADVEPFLAQMIENGLVRVVTE